MKKWFNLLGIIALAAVIGFSMAGCPDPTKAVTETSGITLSVEQIIDGAPFIDSITISRTNNGYPVTYTVSIAASDYTIGSISWEVAGVGSGQTISGTGASFTLNAANANYNSLGGHALLLTVSKDGLQYRRAIPFTIVE
jgi:hypothetical protein